MKIVKIKYTDDFLNRLNHLRSLHHNIDICPIKYIYPITMLQLSQCEIVTKVNDLYYHPLTESQLIELVCSMPRTTSVIEVETLEEL
jgi:hypothetical protein